MFTELTAWKNFGYDLNLFFDELLKWRNEKFAPEKG
jgi:hypothetical protein